MSETKDKNPSEASRRITIRPNPVPKPTASSTPDDEVPPDAGGWTGTLTLLSDRIERLARDMDKAQLREYVDLVHKPWQLIWRNFVSGMSRGVGIALGFTFFAATIVWLLQILGKLNLPIVGDYIADIVRIVHRQLQINPY